MNYCPYCGFKIKNYKSKLNYCPHCGKSLRKAFRRFSTGLTCLICHKYIENKNIKIKCPYCGSSFHNTCAYRWFVNYNSCPYCLNQFIFPKQKY